MSELVRLGLEQRLGQQGERHEQDVPGQHVGDRVGPSGENGPDEDRRDELDDADERLQRRRHAGGREQVTEVAEALVLEAGADEDHPHEQGRNSGMAMRAVAGICRNGKMPGSVAEVDEDEQAEQERRPAQARPGPSSA